LKGVSTGYTTLYLFYTFAHGYTLYVLKRLVGSCGMTADIIPEFIAHMFKEFILYIQSLYFHCSYIIDIGYSNIHCSYFQSSYIEKKYSKILNLFALNEFKTNSPAL